VLDLARQAKHFILVGYPHGSVIPELK